MEVINPSADPLIVTNILSADRKSTTELYDRNFANFADWFNGKGFKISEFNLNIIILFLNKLFDDGKQYSTINNYRYALNPVLFLSTGESLTEGYIIKRVMNGFRKARPKKSTPPPRWDVDVVLRFLRSNKFEPLEDKPLTVVFEKLCFLLIMASGRRPSDLTGLGHAGNLIVWNNNDTHVTLYPHPDFVAKNRSNTFCPEPMSIPALGPKLAEGDNNRLNCPVRALKLFLKRTENKRGKGLSYLLVQPLNCSAKVTPGYVSKTVKRTILRAYQSEMGSSIGVSAMAKDTRKLANSLASHRGAPLAEVIRAGGWSSTSTFVDHYLVKEPLKTSQPVVAAGRIILPAKPANSTIMVRKDY